MTSRSTRIKKFNSRTTFPVLREDQIDPNEYEVLTTAAHSTGVEAAEEGEYHLQAALKGVSTATTDNEIPVPPPQKNEANYDELYPSTYVQPNRYHKFSETVEEMIGCLYDMTTEDDQWLKSYNAPKKGASSQLSEDDFEKIMEAYEDTAAEQAPFASVDNTVVSYDVMAHSLFQTVSPKIQAHAKAVYEYWKTCRQEAGNKPLHPSVKFETHQEKDDMDPYVCFRRREVRQTRKTRARDVQIADKLKKLRRELEDGRQLIIFSQQRELMKRELLHADRLLYDQRAKLKETKVRLGIKDNDEDLYNTRPQKRKISEVTQPASAQRAPTTQLRLAVRPDGRSMETDLTLLADRLAEKENELRISVENKVHDHRKWNQNYVDLTRDPLSPVQSEGKEQSFRPAKTQYLMTPPASASEEMDADDETNQNNNESLPLPVIFRGMTPDDDGPKPQLAFRRRIGRLNRLWIDRRGLNIPSRDASNAQSDQWKYDHDDDEDEQPIYEVDPFSTQALKFRAGLPISSFLYPRQRMAGETNAAAIAATNRQALPPPPAPAPTGQAQPQPQPQTAT